MFATRGSLHTHTFTSFECSFCEEPLSAKKHERVSGMGMLIAGTCKKQVLRKPVSHKRLVLTRRGGESERIQESKNLSVARTVAYR